MSDGAFLRKLLKVFACLLFSKKGAIIGVWLGSKYASRQSIKPLAKHIINQRIITPRCIPAFSRLSCMLAPGMTGSLKNFILYSGACWQLDRNKSEMTGVLKNLYFISLSVTICLTLSILVPITLSFLHISHSPINNIRETKWARDEVQSFKSQKWLIFNFSGHKSEMKV